MEAFGQQLKKPRNHRFHGFCGVSGQNRSSLFLQLVQGTGTTGNLYELCCDTFFRSSIISSIDFRKSESVYGSLKSLSEWSIELRIYVCSITLKYGAKQFPFCLSIFINKNPQRCKTASKHTGGQDKEKFGNPIISARPTQQYNNQTKHNHDK